MGCKLTDSLLKKQGLAAISPRDLSRGTTGSKHNFGFSPNWLKNLLKEPSDTGEIIVGDITYLPSGGGKSCYLATFQDKYTMRIVGWQVSQRMTANFFLDAFNRARKQKQSDYP